MPRHQRLTTIRLVLVAVVAALAPACGPAAAVPPASSSSAPPASAEVAPAPDFTSYASELPPVLLDEDESALRQKLDAEGRCQADPRLALAARRYGALLLAQGEQAAQDPDRLKEIWHALGGLDAVVEPFVAPAGGQVVVPESRGLTHCGVGAAADAGRRLLVVVATRRLVALAPFAARPKVGGRLRLEGRWLAPVREGRLWLGLPDGRARSLPLRSTGGGGFVAEVPLPSPGRYELEALASGPTGPEIAMLVPLWVEVEPAPLVRPVEDPALRLLAEEALVDRRRAVVDRARAALDLPHLARDPALDLVAREHARDMAHRGYFGHRAPGGPSLEERLAAHGVEATLMGENVAQGRDPARLDQNLMLSPAHRATLLDPRFTHHGVAVVKRADELFLTEIFARY